MIINIDTFRDQIEYLGNLRVTYPDSNMMQLPDHLSHSLKTVPARKLLLKYSRDILNEAGKVVRAF